jgi:hypothetical protein
MEDVQGDMYGSKKWMNPLKMLQRSKGEVSKVKLTPQIMPMIISKLIVQLGVGDVVNVVLGKGHFHGLTLSHIGWVNKRSPPYISRARGYHYLFPHVFL